MSLAHGRPYLAIPGPSVIPDRVLAAIQRPSPNIYTGDLVDLTHGLIPDLKTIAGTQHHCAIYIGNGHCAWEAALSNVLNPGDKVLVLVNGTFAQGWAGMAEGLGIEAEQLDFGLRESWDLDIVAERLSAPDAQDIKAVLAIHVDTSTSIRNDIAGLRGVMDRVGHLGLLMADCIASLGCDRFEMDEWGADVMVAACQKGLMTPAGVSFVFFNERADSVRARCAPSKYWDWRPRAHPEEYYQHFDGTAPTHHLYGLREAVTMMLDEGLDAVWSRHSRLAKGVWAALEVWGQEGQIGMNVADPTARSHALTAVEMQNGMADQLRAYVETECGVTLGIGLGRVPASNYLRIGHMGHVNAHMVLGVLGAMEMGLSHLGVAHGRGAIDAAVDAMRA